MPRKRQGPRRQHKNATTGSYSVEELRQRGDMDRRYEPATRKKHRYAVLCGYLGLRYHGLQIQPDPKIATIEKELERAFFLAGGIQECNFGSFHKVNWARAARTDKGVHAVGQIITLNLQLQAGETQQFVDRCNEFLPEDIRVFDCIRVTSGFNPKNLCGRRRYQYLLPTYALQPRDALEAALKEAYDAHDAAHGIAPQQAEETKDGVASAEESSTRPRLALEDLASVVPTLCSWRVDEATLARLRAALNKYVGTHNYHNFTSRMKATDKSAFRYMLSFECSDPMIDDATGQEWVCLTVVGQSFLLNQIRKMVALAVEVARGGVPLEHMDLCLSQSKVLIPIAPGDNLHLDRLFYDAYDAKVLQMHNSTQPSKKQRTEQGATELSHAVEGTSDEQKLSEGGSAEVSLDHRPLDWDSDPVVREKILSFKQAVIWRHIFDLEFQQRTFLLWLDSCRFLAHRFQVVPDDFGWSRAEKAAAEGGAAPEGGAEEEEEDDANDEAGEGADDGAAADGDEL